MTGQDVMKLIGALGTLVAAATGSSFVTSQNVTTSMQATTDVAVTYLVEENRRLQREISRCSD
jgi:hypothetical protein